MKRGVIADEISYQKYQIGNLLSMIAGVIFLAAAALACDGLGIALLVIGVRKVFF